jgi:hypothetical protein
LKSNEEKVSLKDPVLFVQELSERGNKLKNIGLVMLIFIAISAHANDGGIEVVGGALHPVNIANVSMEYERLIITCKESYFEVEAYIELYNHDSAVIRPLLGFEFHNGGTLSGPGNFNFNQYVLFVNNEPQRFEYGEQRNGALLIRTLVYQPELNPGKNTIYHKHQLPYGFGGAQGVVSYLLETSSRWKDGIIKNLEIFIRAEFNTILFFQKIRSSFDGMVLSFDTMGEGKSLNHGMRFDEDGDEYYSLTPNGYLYKHIENFVPNKNISFQLLDFLGMEMYINYNDPPYDWRRENSYITIYDWKRYIENPAFNRYRWGDSWRQDIWRPSENMLEELSTEQLRILRNTLYAIRGYVFNDSFLQEYFNRQYWYFPNPNIAMSDIIFDAAENIILQFIIAEERRR